MTIATEQHGTDTQTELVMDILETAARLRCGRSTVYSLLNDGELTGIKIGRRRLVTYESVVEFVRRQASAQTVEPV